jgi:hypothetical protein
VFQSRRIENIRARFMYLRQVNRKAHREVQITQMAQETFNVVHKFPIYSNEWKVAGTKHLMVSVYCVGMRRRPKTLKIEPHPASYGERQACYGAPLQLHDLACFRMFAVAGTRTPYLRHSAPPAD